MANVLRNYVFWLWLLLPPAICSCFNHGSNFNGRCHEEELKALLQFKHDLDDPSNRLASWTDDGDCCRWFGVICHNSTGNVLEIHLRSLSVEELRAYYDDYDHDTLVVYERLALSGTINHSLLSLKQLRYLDLSNNNFYDESYLLYKRLALSGKINHSLLSLKQLRYLDLSNNNFFGTPIPKFLSSMKSLRVLNLSGAGFEGMIPHELGNLSNLQCLDLKYNVYLFVDSMQWLFGHSTIESLDMRFVNLTKALNWLEVINSLPSLVELHLSFCELPRIPSVPSVNVSSLSILELRGNNLNESSLFHWISGLKSLSSLNLGVNSFQGPIPNQLQNLTSLKQLDLTGNSFSSSLPDWLYSFRHLEILYLGSNQLQGNISSAISNLISLHSLDLSRNEIVNIPMTSFQNLCNLKVLSLSSNFLNQGMNKVIGALSGCIADGLELLDLTGCQLNGPIPMSLRKFSRLRVLNLSDNKLTGPIPASFGELASLESLVISYNLLEGIVSEVHFANLTKLKQFIASGNKLMLNVSPNWIPPLKLIFLYLSTWQVVGSQFPAWLSYLHHLEFLDLSNTGISGMVPFWFWNMSSQLSYLNLSHNQIHGVLPDLSLQSVIIDLSSNHLDGPLPNISSATHYLDLSNNSIVGSLLHFLCLKEHEWKELFFLKLYDNNLSGEIPDCWKSWSSLEYLKLSNNKFRGNIPNSIGYLTSLKYLHLHKNNLSGEIPLSIQNCTELLILDLSENQFLGNIPAWLGNMSEMIILNFRENKYSGHLPKEICDITTLHILDLANNNLSGSVPRCISRFGAMMEMNASDSEFWTIHPGPADFFESSSHRIKGNMVEYSTNLKLVKSIDISGNRFTGKIPNEITSLRDLRYLNMSHNFLRGEIPNDIGAMRILESLDLSQNQLSGEIPQSISTLTFLNDLNVSFNDLKGKIPVSTQLQTLDPSGFIGNQLCGPPLEKNCGANDDIPKNLGNHTSESKDEAEFNWLYLSIALGFIVGFWSVLGPLFILKNFRHRYFRFLEDMTEDLVCKLKACIFV